MTEEAVTTVDLLRHGEPEGGVRYRGSRDDPLNETGISMLPRGGKLGNRSEHRTLTRAAVLPVKIIRSLEVDIKRLGAVHHPLKRRRSVVPVTDDDTSAAFCPDEGRKFIKVIDYINDWGMDYLLKRINPEA